MTEDEPFLARWSRKKLETRETPPEKEKPVEVAPAPPPELPSVDTLDGLRSKYDAFMQSGVDEGTRRAALKKLFADPHFNQMDGLDVYIDDYSLPDPIPLAMLRALNHAKDLLFRDEEEEAPEKLHATPPEDDEPETL